MHASRVSVLYREPKLLKENRKKRKKNRKKKVSVLYREPKLLKAKCGCSIAVTSRARFSALP